MRFAQPTLEASAGAVGDLVFGQDGQSGVAILVAASLAAQSGMVSAW